MTDNTEQKMQQEHKGCPFCGSYPHFIRGNASEPDTVRCKGKNCRLFGLVFLLHDWNTRVSPPEQQTDLSLGKVDLLRSNGWAVAVHNDYKLKGESYTFWLFVKGDRCIKGEAKTDDEALSIVLRAAGLKVDEPQNGSEGR